MRRTCPTSIGKKHLPLSSLDGPPMRPCHTTGQDAFISEGQEQIRGHVSPIRERWKRVEDGNDP